MKTERYSNERIDEYDIRANASIGQVTWSAKKSLWLSFNMLAAVIGGAIFFSWSALLLFIATAGVTLCFGHSIGMHRRLIHNSFYCPQWLKIHWFISGHWWDWAGHLPWLLHTTCVIGLSVKKIAMTITLIGSQCLLMLGGRCIAISILEMHQAFAVKVVCATTGFIALLSVIRYCSSCRGRCCFMLSVVGAGYFGAYARV